MLTVDIVKVWHAGIENAEVLVPHIEECDVYAPENTLSTEVNSSALERELYRHSTSGMDSLAFERKLRSDFKDRPPRAREYVVAEYMNLFRTQKPIFFVERFDPAKADKIDKIKAGFDFNTSKGFSFLADSDVDAYYGYMKRAEDKLYEATKKRDQHIGSVLDRAEFQIRKKYPQLQNKNPIKLAVRVGWAHRPEIYTSVPTKIHTHLSEPTNHWDKFRVDLYKDGQPPKKLDDGLKLLLLRVGAKTLSDAPRHPLQLTPEQISTMSLDELTKVIRKTALSK